MRVSPEVEIAFALAQREAARRRHEFVTVEHLLYALLFDEETAGILRHAGGDPAALKKRLERFLDTEVQPLPEEAESQFPSLSLGFNRAVQRAAMHVQSSGRRSSRARTSSSLSSPSATARRCRCWASRASPASTS